MKNNYTKKGIKRCWYCDIPVREHNVLYCEHIWDWKHGYCKPVGPRLYPKFHRKQHHASVV